MKSRLVRLNAYKSIGNIEGGSEGAFAGDIAAYLVNTCRNKSDLFVGCSTGSLLLAHPATGAEARRIELDVPA